MYKNGYVMSIICKNNVIDEENKRVMIPFDSHYSVRLSNKNYIRCGADLIINGEKIARFLIPGGETIDVERFIDDNLTQGKRFKFVNLNNSAVKDSKDIDNGLIEVHFFEEDITPTITYIQNDILNFSKPYSPYSEIPLWNSPAINTGSCSFSTSNSNFVNNSNDGATVRGEKSNQKFREQSNIKFKSTPTILKIKLYNGDIKILRRYCSSCGRKRRHSENYCSNCGESHK